MPLNGPSENDVAVEMIKGAIGDYIFQIALLKAKVASLEKVINAMSAKVTQDNAK